MISIKKIMSVIAIAFAVMTIAGSGMMVTSFAGTADLDPCTVTDAKLKPAGCEGGFINLFKIVPNKADPLAPVKGVIANVATAFIGILAAISVLFLILGASKMMTDNGDGKGFSAGKDNIKYAIIGLVVAILSFFIISTVINIIR